MKDISIEVAQSHLKSHYSSKDPIKWVVELIWNSLDADSNKIDIQINQWGLWWIDNIVISDNGFGIKYSEIDDKFRWLWKSDKKFKIKTPKWRFYHGQLWHGRFFAFSIWKQVTWNIVYYDEKDGCNYEYSFVWDLENDKFNISDQEKTTKLPWVSVTIDKIPLTSNTSLSITKLENEIISTFANYNLTYQDEHIDISLQKKQLNFDDAILWKKAINFKVLNDDGIEVLWSLSLFHWKDKGIHRRYICWKNANVKYEDWLTGVNLKSFWHSLFVVSDYFDNKSEWDIAMLIQNDQIIKLITDESKKFLKNYYFDLLRDNSQEIIQELKNESIYPYTDKPLNEVEIIEREFFDISVSTIIASQPMVLWGSIESKKLVVNLIKEGIKKDPETLIHIFKNIINLSDEDLDKLHILIKDYWIWNIIRLSESVLNKIKFLDELPLIIQDPIQNKKILERKHLHKIIENELWLFWEWYALWTSDQSLKNLLKRHMQILWRSDFNWDVSVESLDIPDLFLFKQYPWTREWLFDHLIIELKRPSCHLWNEELNQIKKYAKLISWDTQFDKTKTKWEFVLIGNTIKDEIIDEINQRDRERWIAIEWDNYRVRVITWWEIIQIAKWKYTFIKDRLNMEAWNDSENRQSYIQETYWHIFS